MKLNKQPILPGFESGLYERRPVFDRGELESQTLPRDPVRRGNHVNVRLSTEDLAQLQSKSLNDGVPLPSLIASIVRKYLQGDLIENPLADAVRSAVAEKGKSAVSEQNLIPNPQERRKANLTGNN